MQETLFVSSTYLDVLSTTSKFACKVDILICINTDNGNICCLIQKILKKPIGKEEVTHPIFYKFVVAYFFIVSTSHWFGVV